jgi:diaminobutyrate-2-oxoglutarate transaminase
LTELEELSFPVAPKLVTAIPGPKSKKVITLQKKYESGVVSYGKAIPLGFEEGRGATIKDMDGNIYIDFFGGAGVLNVGHSNPEVLRAVSEQEKKLVHALDFATKPKLDLVRKLVEIAPGRMRNHSKVFFGGPTGSDAVEAAVKLAKVNTGRMGVMAFEGGYHGMTSGALAYGSGKKFKETFMPLVPEVHFAPYAYCYRCPFGKKDGSPEDCCMQCVEYVRHIFADPHSGVVDPAAMLVEAVQGEGGTIVPPDNYISELRKVSDDFGIPLIIDEIQAGLGRTGKMFACELSGTTPDIMTLSKGLGGIGFPLSACVCLEEMDKFSSGAHIGTFRGQAVSMAAGFAALNYMEKHDLPGHALKLGAHMLKRLKEIEGKSKYIGDVRGRGLMIGIEFVRDKKTKEPAEDIARDVRKLCYPKGLIVELGGHYNNVVRFLPPLVLTQELADKGIDIFAEAVKESERSA